jgi:hypothetical protein
MALEFRTRDENYKGPRILPSKTVIQKASIFVDHLPPGFPTEPYSPYLANDQYSHRRRYVIDANIFVETDCITILGIPHKGRDSIDRETVQTVTYNSIERNGLDIVLLHLDRKYQGIVYPMLEPTVEAYPPHLARYGHRPP